MKILALVVSFLVLLCVASSDENGRSTKDELIDEEEGSITWEDASTPEPMLVDSQMRFRRSPPKFDSNQMKGKYAKANRNKRSPQIPQYFKMIKDKITGRRKRSLMDVFEPTPALLSTAPVA